MTAGTHVITVRVTDNVGAQATSSAVIVSVADNIRPEVSMIATPTNATAPATIMLNAAASDADDSVARVEFFNGATLLASIFTSPYAYTWMNVAAGTYMITAKVIDDAGAVSVSEPATIIVADNVPPVVSMIATPANATAPGTILLNAAASNADGSVARVEFFNGSTLVASVSAAPYVYNWMNVAAGNYTITARATDELGAVTISESAAIKVTATPAVAKVHYIDSDHLNTPRVITDGNNQIVWKWENNDPFGDNLPQEEPGSTGNRLEFNLRFPGQYFDHESGLHYNYHRTYDPSIGRYVESDPIGLAGGMNTYAYSLSNPIRYTDPTGLDVFLCSQPAFGMSSNPIYHEWIKTDSIEAGMGGTRGNVPGNDSGDFPGDRVQVTDHTGRSKEAGASCQKVDNVDENKVNAQLKLGRALGKWGPTNQCQSFVRGVIDNARTIPASLAPFDNPALWGF
ncbi:MAG: Ig-like domain-containing protein [Pseudomonadota bacterium]